jgi:hypothetical protein
MSAITKQKLDIVTAMRTLADQFLAINEKARTAVELQQTIGITEQDILDGLFDGTAHDGLSWALVANAIGSLAAFATATSGEGGFMAINGVNFRSIKP